MSIDNVSVAASATAAVTSAVVAATGVVATVAVEGSTQLDLQRLPVSRFTKETKHGQGSKLSSILPHVRSDRKHHILLSRVLSRKQLLVNAVLQTNILLVLAIGSLILSAMILSRISFHTTHWVFISINLFEMVPCNIFTSVIAFNVLANLITDTAFRDKCLFGNSLLPMIYSMVYSAGYYHFLLTLIALLWGSTFTLFFETNVVSILVLIFLAFVVFTPYIIVLVRKTNEQK